MSQKREKKRRRDLREDYLREMMWWVYCEPPRWRFISHWLWKKDKPVPPKGVKE